MECYVCTEPAFSLSPCACKNLYLHEDCYAKLLAYDNKRCGICLQDYPLPDIEAPAVYTKPSTTTDTSTALPILCRIKPVAVHFIDGCLEPLRHFFLIFILMNVIKYIFTVGDYSFAFFQFDDYMFWLYAIVFYFFICLVVRGVHRHND
tara:strand:+ start:683 stop:1129 length:447 start_codon:yes stop_codon:yes gene_type:complete